MMRATATLASKLNSIPWSRDLGYRPALISLCVSCSMKSHTLLCGRNHGSKRKVLKMYELATNGNVEFRQMPNFLQQFVRIVSFEQLVCAN
jgi:hypothetical protein